MSRQGAAVATQRPTRLLLPGDGNTKLRKNALPTLGLSLAPGSKGVCPHATAECRRMCLTYAGKGGLRTVQEARARRLAWWKADPEGFKQQLRKELRAAYQRQLQAHPRKKGPLLAVRLNVLSDIRWEREMPEVFMEFPRIQFYDYTKWPLPERPPEELPANYHLTYSFNGYDMVEAWNNIVHGRNVAVVFDVRPGLGLPRKWHERLVIDGDLSDERWLDPSGGWIIGLRAKGRARKKGPSRGGFVQEVDPLVPLMRGPSR